MKRWIAAIAAAVVMAIALCLFMPVNRQSDLEGEWYAAEEGTLYVFRDGIIECQEHFYVQHESAYMSGAYLHAANRVTLFLRGIDALADVEELYLVRSEKGYVLNDAADGSGNTYFYREWDEAVAAVSGK